LSRYLGRLCTSRARRIPSDQRRYFSRYRNLQYGRPGFAPGRDRGFLDLLKIIEADRVAPVPLRYGTMSRPGMSRPGTPGVSSSTANDLRMQYSSLLVALQPVEVKHYIYASETKHS